MNQKEYLLKGTFLLTAAGLLSRFAGFFYKIFLSRQVGAENMGLYQMILPLYAFCAAAAFGGVQTAVSRQVSLHLAQKEKSRAWEVFGAGLFFSVAGSLLLAVLLFFFSSFAAGRFLGEPRCAALLRILSFSLPFAAVHSCVCGYLMGQKKILLPALSQLAEQLFRILFSVGVCVLFLIRNHPLSAMVLVLGQVAGEIAASVFCAASVLFSRPPCSPKKSRLFSGLREILSISLPFSSSRMLLCVLQAMEAALLPLTLRRFGLSSSQALSLYGAFTGMALPLILFPTAVTGSLGTILLPAVSEASSKKQAGSLQATIRSSFFASLYLGFFCANAFLLFGEESGTLLFGSQDAGRYVVRLSFLCPFLYLNTTLSSILHGLGKTGTVSFLHSFSSVLRLLSVVFLVPFRGMEGYLYGMLLAQVFLFAAFLILLYRSCGFFPDPGEALVLPLALCLAASGAVYCFRALNLVPEHTWPAFLLEIGLYLPAFFLPAFLFFRRKTAESA